MTERIINSFGPRLPGSNACLKTADFLKKEYQKYCHRVIETDYEQYPDAIFYIPTVAAVTYIVGGLFLVSGLAVLSTVTYALGLSYFIVQFILFENTFDRLFKKYPEKTVCGIIEPTHQANQQIIVSAHHDSPYICNFLSGNQKLYAFRLFLPFLFYLFAFFASMTSLLLNNVLDLGYIPRVWKLRDVGD
jgi:aminopeptidase YwaD